LILLKKLEVDNGDHLKGDNKEPDGRLTPMLFTLKRYTVSEMQN
jgi:hypothetical protein